MVYTERKYEHMFVFLWHLCVQTPPFRAIMEVRRGAEQGKPCAAFKAANGGIARRKRRDRPPRTAGPQAASGGRRGSARRARGRGADAAVQKTVREGRLRPRAGGRPAEEETRVKEYQELILFLYPRLGRAAEDIGEVVEAKALASVSGRECAERCAERLLAYLHMRDCFLTVKAAVEEVAAALTEEERYLLEYKYFRRKPNLEGEFAGTGLRCSLRTYYRKQERLARRVNALFLRAGLTEAWFAANLAGLPFFASALRCLRARRGALVDKRAARALQLRKKA